MSLNARKIATPKTKGPQQEAIEAGSYPCRIVQIVDMGMQPQCPYQGEEKPPAHEMMITYELTDEFCKGEDGKDMEDKPRWLSEDFPLRSLESDLAKSTKRYYALDPDEIHGGDFTALIGMPCNVTVVQNKGKGKFADRVFNNIQAVSTMRPKDSQKCAELVSSTKVFLLDEPDLEVYKSFPEWIQKKLKSNLEYKGSALEGALEGSGEPSEKEEFEDLPEATGGDW